jgi:hypothetical protein
MWILKKVLSQPSCSNFWTNRVRSHCIQFFSSFCYSSKGRTICAQVSEDEDEVENNLFLGFWGWGWGWKQSVLEFLRMTLKTICAWVSEDDDEHEEFFQNFDLWSAGVYCMCVQIANSRPFVSETVVLKEGLTLLKVQLSILHYYPLNTWLSSTECGEMSHVSWVWAKLTILTLPIAYRKFDFHKYDWNSGMQILYNDGLAQVLSWFLLAYLHSVLGADEVSG